MNPVELELVKLKRRWNQELKLAGSLPLIICSGEKHETDLFDGFMKSKMASENNGEDIYLLHYQNFDHAQSFGESLYKEWKYFYEGLKDTAFNELPAWPEVQRHEASTDAGKAFYPLLALRQQFPALEGLRFFLYIAPLRIADKAALNDWIKDWCRLCRKERIDDIKLVWAEHQEHKTLPENDFAHRFRLQIDIHQLMQQTAAHSNRQKNSTDTDYQQQMLTASNHLSKTRFQEAQLSLNKAVKLAQEMNNVDGELAALFMSAQAFAAQRKADSAEAVYQRIFDLVVPGTMMEVQMYMGYGGFLLGESKKRKAEQAFLKAAEVAEQHGNYAMALECYRTMGVLYDSPLTRSKMLAYYEKCLTMGRLMDADTRNQSSLRYVASVLANRYSGKERDALLTEMVAYFGEDWMVPTEAPAKQ